MSAWVTTALAASPEGLEYQWVCIAFALLAPSPPLASLLHNAAPTTPPPPLYPHIASFLHNGELIVRGRKGDKQFLVLSALRYFNSENLLKKGPELKYRNANKTKGLFVSLSSSFYLFLSLCGPVAVQPAALWADTVIATGLSSLSISVYPHARSAQDSIAVKHVCVSWGGF